jgi:excisionase family DNA binding protein
VILEFPDAILETLVDEIAGRVAERLNGSPAGTAGWMNVEQAAGYLACPKSRIHDLVAQERLQYAKDGRRTLFRREWLDDVLTTPGLRGSRR